MKPKTYCVHGHEYTPENTVIQRDGHRHCLACARLRNRLWTRKRYGYQPRKSPQEIFWSKVEKTQGCWNWTGWCDPEGYGHLGAGGKWVGAHRFSFELANGSIPEGLELDHLCRNKRCVNPEHLEVVTSLENQRRRPKKTHCPHGHEFTPENTYVRRGAKSCITCHRFKNRIWMRTYNKKKRASRKA